MTSPCDHRVDATVLDASSILAIVLGRSAGAMAVPLDGRPRVSAGAPLVGAWRSPDGTVRLELRTDGTYAGGVAGRRQPARGTYQLDGGSVVLRDGASGLQTAVIVHDGELEMAGHRLLPV
ncbi:MULTISPECIES: Atu4866 domain-containing protein [Actinoplanes]|uniref:Atu4866 domain-containing protein n=1 Tax=Actinoplanes TaxID=1865 RepID=UPI0005F2C7E1|nr:MULTISPECIES: Atu4866 domain-containing protein [Actinoplanes]GLY05954.1 hypothetical protein Acsp01_63330 [Actinoplanes sp. NBRC 101535]